MRLSSCQNHVVRLFCTALALIGVFGTISPALAETNETLVIRTGVQKNFEQEPGIIGLDMWVFKNRQPMIREVFPGSPAQMKGLQAGDTILEVNGVSTTGKSQREIDQLISDVPGSSVGLKVQRGFMVANITLVVESLSYVSSRLRSHYSNMSFDSYE